jgi:hypothetical protein
MLLPNSRPSRHLIAPDEIFHHVNVRSAWIEIIHVRLAECKTGLPLQIVAIWNRRPDSRDPHVMVVADFDDNGLAVRG